MKRREFLGSVAGGVVATGMGLKAAPVEAIEIIDCHTHFYDPMRSEGVPWPPKESSLYRTVLPEHLRAQKQYRPVTGTVVVEASHRLEDNAWLLDLAKRDPFIVGVVGNLKPGGEGFAAHLKRFGSNPVYRGFRVSAELVKDLLKRKELTDLKRVIDADLSLDVNGGPETPGVIAALSGELPELRIVLNHIGNVHITGAPPPVDWVEGIKSAGRAQNIYCKISALMESAARGEVQAPADLDFYRPYIDVVWNSFGDERVIYGSDWPVSERAGDYAEQQRIIMEYASERGEGAVRGFCAENAFRAYKWKRRGS